MVTSIEQGQFLCRKTKTISSPSDQSKHRFTSSLANEDSVKTSTLLEARENANN